MMKRFISMPRCIPAVLFMVLFAASAWADDAKHQMVTVSFGAGLNTAQPGNAVNHQILPDRIRIKQGGVVNFIVAGFHQVFVYNRGTEPEDILVPADGLFINHDLDNLYYQGINPLDPPPEGLSNAQNRVETVYFDEPGIYLVICNVRPHFLDGMYTFIRVDR